ncbi:MAG: protein kinase domain-containing protein [Planctomycetota bacterium]|jgi:serine/threonine protein kinase
MADTEDFIDSESSPPQQDLTGSEIAGCSVLEKLGQGAMGTVYLAEQINLQRKVALKILDPKFSRDLVYIERFEREAQASARLINFNVVQVYDFGRENELYYIISEFVDGSTVQDLIEELGTVPSEHAAELILQSARGMAAAQEAGIVHRDIKPENLMITRDGVVKIADFGLAKVVKDDASVTQSGMIVGTPFYMSPEQAKGETLDVRSDLYSLGVTYFHMVTGQIPFDGDSIISVLLQHISGERPNPSDINPAIPGIVSDVIMKMMAQDPENRYPGFDSLVPALEELLKRLQSGDTGESSLEAYDENAVDKERSKRYKLLKKTLVANIVKKEVPELTLNKMAARVKSDTGVFVESKEVYPENSIVEMRFTVPGRTSLVNALGLVRWNVESGPRMGMGITFLKVNPVQGEDPKPNTSALVRRSRLSTSTIINTLSETPAHGRLLRYYYANTGRNVNLNGIANSMGVGTRGLDKYLKLYKSLGLVIENNNEFSFVWPEDKELQNGILDWIQQYGLK